MFYRLKQPRTNTVHDYIQYKNSFNSQVIIPEDNKGVPYIRNKYISLPIILKNNRQSTETMSRLIAEYKGGVETKHDLSM